MKLVDLTGKTFEQLTVLERAENAVKPSGKIETQWMCKCSCGSLTVVRYKNLINGHTKSCGCRKHKERTKAQKVQKARKAKKAKKGSERMGAATFSCHLNPGLICDYRKCSNCGWNPKNKELREKRIEKLRERKNMK